MFCGKCGHMIDDNAKFCPFCGNVMQQEETNVPTGVGYQQPYVQPVYQPAGSAPYTQPPVQRIGASRQKINKAGFILAVILSALALANYLLCLIEDVGYVIDGTGYIGTYMDFAFLFFGFLPLFILCLNLKKLPAFVLGFTFVLLILYRLLGVISTLLRVPIFGIEFSFGVVPMIAVFTLLAGIVLYMIAMGVKHSVIGLKIPAAILLGFTGLYYIYDFAVNCDFVYWLSTHPLYLIGWSGYAFSMLFAVAALIVVMFTSKKRD